MPTQRAPAKVSEDEYRNRLLRLEEIGVPIGKADDPAPKPIGLSLEQIQDGQARIYELCPLSSTGVSQVAVIVPAELTIHKTVTLTTSSWVTLPWDDCALESSDADDCPQYKHLIAGLPWPQPTNLIDLLARGVPLGPRQAEGIIIATGWSSVPAKFHDESLVTVKLVLSDVRGNEFCFDFAVFVDRSFKRKYEWRQKEALRSVRRSGLYDQDNTKAPDQTRTTKNEGGHLPLESQAFVSKY